MFMDFHGTHYLGLRIYSGHMHKFRYLLICNGIEWHITVRTYKITSLFLQLAGETRANIYTVRLRLDKAHSLETMNYYG